MADTRVREFNATKCIFASSCVEDVCLDDDGPFDSAYKDSKAQLQAILKGGRGHCPSLAWRGAPPVWIAWELLSSDYEDDEA